MFLDMYTLYLVELYKEALYIITCSSILQDHLPYHTKAFHLTKEQFRYPEIPDTCLSSPLENNKGRER